VEPQTPETSPNPAASQGMPAAEAAQPTAAATEQPARTESAQRPASAPQGAPADTDPAGLDAKVTELEDSLRARTEDLQRLQAEYVNYKRRVDRDRDVAKNAGTEAVVTDLMSVLDNLRSAREHEEMTAGLRLLVDELDKIAAKHGLETFGAKGELFDPTVHEALMQAPLPGATEATVLEVMQIGYRFRGRVLRPARVAVGMPAPAAPTDPGSAESTLSAPEASEPTPTGPASTASGPAGASPTGSAEPSAQTQPPQPESVATERTGGEGPGR
jgi:molecular chaperone GrpE